MTENNKIDVKIILLFALSIFAMIILSIYELKIFNNSLANEMVSNSISRTLGGIVFVVVMVSLGYKKLFQFKGPFGKSLLLIIPGLIVAVNNFPIIAFFDNRAEITEPAYTIYLFLIESLSTGFFEEIVFRAIILIILLDRFPNTKKGMYYAIITSSAIFGLIHLVNLFSGAGFTDTLMQIGYSFLMGMMWAVVYLKTKNIWYSVILHSTYNFFGLILFRLGYVNGRYDNITVITTVILAVIVAGFYIRVSIKVDIDKSNL